MRDNFRESSIFDLPMTPRRPPQPPEDRSLTVDDMRNGIARLQRRLDELKALDPRSVTDYRSSPIVSLETGIEQTLGAVFGQGTPKFKLYRAACDLEPAPVLTMTPSWIAARGGGGGGRNGVNVHELQQVIAERQQRAMALLEQAIKGLEEEIAYRGEEVPQVVATAIAKPQPGNKVFLVHGHDNTTLNAVALFLRAIGLDPIILRQRPNGGRHLLTKFREESEGASFAVVLMTPDDEGGITGKTERHPRARQNVVFELGFFIGRLGPANVAALMKGNIEKPSDFDGIGYIEFDDSGRWKTELARELHHAGVPFNPAAVFTA
jgi:predicted nucleotide-binding protein